MASVLENTRRLLLTQTIRKESAHFVFSSCEKALDAAKMWLGTGPAGGTGVTPCLALLAEPDPAFRALLSQVLRSVHWEVEACSSLSHLQAKLGGCSGLDIQRLLVVSSTLLASACAEAISELARARKRNGLRPVQVLFTCELGELERPLPHLEPAELVGTLEKPFDIELFEEIARTSLAPNSGNEISHFIA